MRGTLDRRVAGTASVNTLVTTVGLSAKGAGLLIYFRKPLTSHYALTCVDGPLCKEVWNRTLSPKRPSTARTSTPRCWADRRYTAEATLIFLSASRLESADSTLAPSVAVKKSSRMAS